MGNPVAVNGGGRVCESLIGHAASVIMLVQGDEEMALTREQVAHIAELAKLKLT
jgi:hypothetical protein